LIDRYVHHHEEAATGERGRFLPRNYTSDWTSCFWASSHTTLLIILHELKEAETRDKMGAAGDIRARQLSIS
jgi:hypothetical protein